MSNPAETYEREMVPAVFGPWVPPLMRAAGPRAGEQVLDLACGTGVVARQVASLVGPTGRVVGLDLSPAMLAVARASAEREGHRIEWHEGRAEALPFPDGTFDLVLCQQGLQFVPDRPRAAAEMYRVLREGGRAVVSVWLGLDRHPFYANFNEVVIRHLGIPALAAPFSLGDADELRRLLSAAGFCDITIEVGSLPAQFPDPARFVTMMVDVIAAAIPSAQHLDAQARAALATAIADEMTGSIRDFSQGGRLVIPFHAHMALAYRRAA
jgi:ubiquinone/menaquinone biosynthesis C-methylase UbiE